MHDSAASVWVIAGKDPTGLAGIDADLDTLRDFNIGFDPGASVLKVGAIGNKQDAETIIKQLEFFHGTIIFDPVLNATSGKWLSDPDAVELLIPHVDVLTPNVIEAERLLQTPINNFSDMTSAAQKLLKYGCKSVLLKGGHLSGEYAHDFFTDGVQSFWLNNKRIIDGNTRGTGCRLSSAIAASLAQGDELNDALVRAKMYLHANIRGDKKLTQLDLPWVSDAPSPQSEMIFPQHAIGFYPIVDSADWVNFLTDHKAPTIQLRIKNNKVESELQRCPKNIFLNDYWELALLYKTHGVHLGQEDLATADIEKIYLAGLHLGISTHCHFEVARAHTYRPSYMAYGPIYSTTSKAMRFTPRGLARLQYWRDILNYPIVAIGGIDLNNHKAVLQTGVSGTAVISAITQADDPQQALQTFLEHYETRST